MNSIKNPYKKTKFFLWNNFFGKAHLLNVIVTVNIIHSPKMFWNVISYQKKKEEDLKLANYIGFFIGIKRI
jgi:hypothetical protein